MFKPVGSVRSGKMGSLKSSKSSFSPLWTWLCWLIMLGSLYSASSRGNSSPFYRISTCHQGPLTDLTISPSTSSECLKKSLRLSTLNPRCGLRTKEVCFPPFSPFFGIALKDARWVLAWLAYLSIGILLGTLAGTLLAATGKGLHNAQRVHITKIFAGTYGLMYVLMKLLRFLTFRLILRVYAMCYQCARGSDLRVRGVPKESDVDQEAKWGALWLVLCSIHAAYSPWCSPSRYWVDEVVFPLLISAAIFVAILANFIIRRKPPSPLVLHAPC